MAEKLIISELTDAIDAMLNGEPVALHPLSSEIIAENKVSEEVIKLHESLSILLEKQQEASGFMLQLSKGNLELDPPKSNFLISPFKDLHSSLRHLIWQTQRIAEGDYKQRIHFMGDFSASFNLLIDTLKEKEAAESALQISERRSRLFLENATDEIFVFDLDLKLIYISPSCINIFGYYDSERIKQPMDSIFTTEDIAYQQKLIAESVRHFKATGENRMVTYELKGRHKNGYWVWIEITARLLLDDEEKILGVQGSARNISLRKLAEEAIQRKNKDLEELNATKDKFFSIIAHDLRGPIGSMNSLLELISEPDIQVDREKNFELLNVLKDVSKTTFDLLENLLIWAGSQRGIIEFNPKFYNLNKLVEHNLSLFSQAAKHKGITLNNEVQSGCIAYFDYNMINTVTRNLINNSIKYSNLNGSVTISVRETADNLEVSVKDAGIGIRKETLDKLFRIDSVSTSRIGTCGEKGTGLGLILCKEFIDKHEGKIGVESEPEKGSTFSFELPKRSPI